MGKKKLRTDWLRAIVFFLFIIPCTGTHAQHFAVKTNLLSDATANLSLGGEVALAPRWTMDVAWELNAWKFRDNKQWRHWDVMPEARYWFCDRWNGHFLGVHAFGGQYNMGGLNHPSFSLFGTHFNKLKDARYQGWFVGGGVAYGYDWILSRHWNLEAEVGVGYGYTRYDRFRCAGCGKKVEENQPHHYVGLTKAAINIIYIF